MLLSFDRYRARHFGIKLLLVALLASALVTPVPMSALASVKRGGQCWPPLFYVARCVMSAPIQILSYPHSVVRSRPRHWDNFATSSL